MHETAPPSNWLLRWAHLMRPGGQVLDLACGPGRHVRWLAAHGFHVTAVDRDAQALAGLVGIAERIEADLEGGPWPLPQRQFDAVLVTNYLWRPLWPALREALAPGGVLLYETFAEGNETVGRPSRPDFLLRHGELLGHCSTLRVVAYEDGFVESPQRFVQRIAAVRPRASAQPLRLRLPESAPPPGGARSPG